MKKSILLFGIGQSGCELADLFSRKMNNAAATVSVFAVDTDERTLSTVVSSEKISMVENRSLYSVVDTLGAENIGSWFPCNWESDKSEFAKCLEMNKGSNQWRMKALLSFASYFSKEKNSDKFRELLKCAINTDEAESEIDVYYVASLAGGTGSGLLLPLSLYVKKEIEGLGKKISYSKAFLIHSNVFESCLMCL